MTPLADSLNESVARYVAAADFVRYLAERAPSLREWCCDTDSSISPQLQLIQFSPPAVADWQTRAKCVCAELRASYNTRDTGLIEAKVDGWRLLLVPPFSATEGSK